MSVSVSQPLFIYFTLKINFDLAPPVPNQNRLLQLCDRGARVSEIFNWTNIDSNKIDKQSEAS